MQTTKQAITPGQWIYNSTAGKHDFEVYPQDGPQAGRTVALVRDFNEANARVIAAAPELAALASKLAHYYDVHWHGSAGIQNTGNPKELVAEAQALLKRIEE